MRIYIFTVLITELHALVHKSELFCSFVRLLLADCEMTTLSPACISTSTSIFNFVLLPFLFANTISLAGFSIKIFFISHIQILIELIGFWFYPTI